MGEAPLLHLLKSHFYDTSDATHPLLTPFTLGCKGPEAQIGNNLYSHVPPEFISHSHPPGYGKVPSHPFLGSNVSDYSSASREAAKRRWAVVRVLQPHLQGLCGRAQVGKYQRPSGSLGRGRKALQWPSRLGMTREQATDTAMHYLSMHLLNNVNQDITVYDGKPVWKRF